MTPEEMLEEAATALPPAAKEHRAKAPKDLLALAARATPPGRPSALTSVQSALAAFRAAPVGLGTLLPTTPEAIQAAAKPPGAVLLAATARAAAKAAAKAVEPSGRAAYGVTPGKQPEGAPKKAAPKIGAVAEELGALASLPMLAMRAAKRAREGKPADTAEKLKQMGLLYSWVYPPLGLAATFGPPVAQDVADIVAGHPQASFSETRIAQIAKASVANPFYTLTHLRELWRHAPPEGQAQAIMDLAFGILIARGLTKVPASIKAMAAGKRPPGGTSYREWLAALGAKEAAAEDAAQMARKFTTGPVGEAYTQAYKGAIKPAGRPAPLKALPLPPERAPALVEPTVGPALEPSSVAEAPTQAKVTEPPAQIKPARAPEAPAVVPKTTMEIGEAPRATLEAARAASTLSWAEGDTEYAQFRNWDVNRRFPAFPQTHKEFQIRVANTPYHLGPKEPGTPYTNWYTVLDASNRPITRVELSFSARQYREVRETETARAISKANSIWEASQTTTGAPPGPAMAPAPRAAPSAPPLVEPTVGPALVEPGRLGAPPTAKEPPVVESAPARGDTPLRLKRAYVEAQERQDIMWDQLVAERGKSAENLPDEQLPPRLLESLRAQRALEVRINQAEEAAIVSKVEGVGFANPQELAEAIHEGMEIVRSYQRLGIRRPLETILAPGGGPGKAVRDEIFRVLSARLARRGAYYSSDIIPDWETAVRAESDWRSLGLGQKPGPLTDEVRAVARAFGAADLGEYPTTQARRAPPATTGVSPVEQKVVGNEPPVAPKPSLETAPAAPPAEAPAPKAPVPSPAFEAANPELHAEYLAAKARITERTGQMLERLKGEEGAVDWSSGQLRDIYNIGVYHAKRLAYNFKEWKKAVLADVGDGLKPFVDDLWLALTKKEEKADHAPAAEAERGVSIDRIRADRERLGLAPIQEPGLFRRGDLNYEKGKARVDAGEDIQQLAREAGDPINTRPLTDEDVGAMEYRLNQIDDALSTATTEQTLELNRMRDEIHQGLRIGGSRHFAQLGQQLQRRIQGDPFGLGEVYQTAKENWGHTLTAQEIERLRGIQGDYERAKNAWEAERERILSDYEARRAAEEKPSLGKQARARGGRKVSVPSDLAHPSWGTENTIITSAVRDAARARMQARAANLSMNADPLAVADLAIEIGFHVEAGARFSYKVMHAFLTEEFGAGDRDIRAGWSLAMDKIRQAASVKRAGKALEEVQQAIKEQQAIPKPPPMKWTRESVRARVELQQARDRLIQVLEPRASIGRVRRLVTGTLSAPTGWMATGDNSIMGRQGFNMLWYRPRTWARAYKGSTQALLSEGTALLLDDAYRANEHFPLAQQSGLFHADLSARAWDPAQAEEMAAYMRPAEKLPIVGKVPRAADRAFTIGGNILREDAFYRMADYQGNRWTSAEYRDYASLLNKLTMRGELGRFAAFGPELNALLISSRNVAATWQVGLTMIRGSRAVRLEATKALVAQAAAVGSLGLALRAAGADVGFNPDDATTFLKARFGNTRFDLIPGSQRTQIITAWRVFKKLWQQGPWGKGLKYGEPDASDAFELYIGRKAPGGTQLLKELWTGRDWLGQRISPKKAVLESVVIPWNAQDIRDAWLDQGPMMAALVAAGVYHGIGAQTFQPGAWGRRATPALPGWNAPAIPSYR